MACSAVCSSAARWGRSGARKCQGGRSGSPFLGMEQCGAARRGAAGGTWDLAAGGTAGETGTPTRERGPASHCPWECGTGIPNRTPQPVLHFQRRGGAPSLGTPLNTELGGGGGTIELEGEGGTTELEDGGGTIELETAQSAARRSY